jgi:hypothetical protein
VQILHVLILCCIASVSGFAQIGGRNSFEFLNLPPSARQAGLGGINVSLADRDVALFSSNPALVGDTLNGLASVSYQFYLADIGSASFVYAHDFNKVGQLIFGVQHMGYGSIQGYDASGIETAAFTAGETAFMIGRQHQIKHFRLGLNLKAIFSTIAGYRASAIVADLGGTFIHPEKNLVVALAIKNAGFVLSDYTGDENNLPFDIQLGTTFKPQHMPLRFTLTAFNLSQKDIAYYNASVGDSKPTTVQKILNHINVGTELLIHRNISILLGYNFLNHRALKLEGGGGGAGLSMGFSATIKSFEFIFSRQAYVAGNAGYCFTLSANLNRILKRQ